MHTLLLLISFSIIYVSLKREYFKIEKANNWMHRSGLVCYVLGSAALFLFAVTLDFWIMFITGCIAFHTHNWDTLVSLSIGVVLWGLLAVSFLRSFWSQWKLQKILGLVSPCQSSQALRMLEDLASRISLEKLPQLATYRSNRPYAATLFYKNPVILLSSWMLEFLDEDQLEAVLAHELAHIQRKDNMMVSAVGILKNVLFFLPIIRQTWDKFLMDLETAADDLAVLTTGNPEALASAIIEVHREHPKIEFAYGISYFTPDYQHIEERVERLLNQDAERLAQITTASFSSLLFSKDILISAALSLLVLFGVLFVPYCHWLVHHHL